MNNDVVQVKKDIEELVGQRVVIKCNCGKRKTKISKGLLESAYPNLFRFKEDNSMCVDSYSYNDIITNRVELLAKGESETNDFIMD